MHLGRVPSKQMARVKQGRASQGGSETQVPGRASLLGFLALTTGRRDWLVEKPSRGEGWREPGRGHRRQS